MRSRFRKFDWNVVARSRPKLLSGLTLFLVKPVSPDACLDCTAENGVQRVSLEHGATELVANSGNLGIVSCNGAWRYQHVSLASFMKLCAFIDHGAGVPLSHSRERDFVTVHIDRDIGSKDIEAWLIDAVLRGAQAVQPLLEWVRTQEPYHLVRYLLAEHTSTKTICELGERYGLSKSHFNRLCRQVLGNGVKRELRKWRAVEAVLEVFEHRDGMAAIAFEHGFSSASHFSREIKQLFGVSPRHLLADQSSIDKEN